MMENKSPKPDDHCRIQILVTAVSGVSKDDFCRLFEKLSHIDSVKIPGILRCVKVKFVKEVNAELFRLSDLQLFRKIYGLVCISNCDFYDPQTPSSSHTHSNDEVDYSSFHRNKNAQEEDDGLTFMAPKSNDDLRDHQTSSQTDDTFSEIKQCYYSLKADLSSSLVDSRCLIFGLGDTFSSEPPEIVPFVNSLNTDSDILMGMEELERLVHELVHSIYFVLESKRMDNSYEKKDNLSCPTLSQEEKYQFGIDNPKAKRKRTLGRNRKITGDYALLTGLPESAIVSYQSAIDCLKVVNDLLWLGAAYEGWCCAMMLLKYRNKFVHSSNSNDPSTAIAIHRVPTITDPLFTSLEHDKSSTHRHSRSDLVGTYMTSLSRSSSAKTGLVDGTDEASSETDAESSENCENGSIGLEASNAHSSPEFYRKLKEKEQNQQPNDEDKKLRIFGGGIGTVPEKKRSWRQLIDTFSSSNKKDNNSKLKGNLSLPMGFMSPVDRSSSVQNLTAINTSLPAPTPYLMNGVNSTANGQQHSPQATSRHEIFERFKLALENYKKFSYVVLIEYECVMRSVSVLIFYRQFIEAEQFLREYNGKYLDDKFSAFDNKMKSDVCMANSVIFGEIRFRRKCAFFQRLAVLFRLHVEDNEVRTESDYKEIYPVIHQSLRGYGISENDDNERRRKGRFFIGQKPVSHFPSGLQIKAIHETYICAQRAGYYDIAVRQLCYIIQNYFECLDKAVILQMIEELHKNVKFSTSIHELDKPIVLEEVQHTPFPVRLMPLQLSKIPSLSSFVICPLLAHLDTSVMQKSSTSKIFIYSPFHDRKLPKKEIFWVLNCHCEVSFRFFNPLPVEIVVKNLILITEGCKFDPIPVKIVMPSCYNPSVDCTESKEFKLSGFPRSVGRLSFVGYSYEIFGVKNVCHLSNTDDKRSRQNFTVQVLGEQPLLEVETLMPRMPVLNGQKGDAIAELIVFSGQNIDQFITLYNSSNSILIRRVVIETKQPQVCAGPKLLRIFERNDSDNAETDCVFDIKPRERKEIKLSIFGIDPTTSTLANEVTKEGNQQIGEEHKFFLKPSDSAGQMTAVSVDRVQNHHASPEKQFKATKKQLLSVPGHKRGSSLPLSNAFSVTNDPDSAEKLLDNADGCVAGHDLIPYTGRVLSTEVAFMYISDVVSTDGEEFCRHSRLPMAITIVPAVIVSDWHVLHGDTSTSRYVILDVTNQSKADAELTYGNENVLCVHPNETRRVNILCPCCTTIKSSDFQLATKRASHMLQMREIDQLRRKIEGHLSGHLEIRWLLPKYNINGVIPMGSLLSSVSFLKQLAIPTLSLIIEINGRACGSGDMVVGIGEKVHLKIGFLCSFQNKDSVISGQVELSCFQEVHSLQPSLAKPDDLFVFGPYQRHFRISGMDHLETDSSKAERSEADEIANRSMLLETCQKTLDFGIAFLFEGVYKLQPLVSNLALCGTECSIGSDDVFIPTLSFNVTTQIR